MATTHDEKAILLRYLQEGRDAVLWKLEGVSEYDARRPMTATGTNLLGLVKHLASMEAGYLGETFGRPLGEPQPWDLDPDDPNADMYATAEESRDDIVARYRRACTHANATVHALPLDTLGTVPWWPEERREVTLEHILVRMIAETHHHAGHMDIVRESIDGRVGEHETKGNMPTQDATQWRAYVARLEEIAQRFR